MVTKMVIKSHYCPSCGERMEKESGTKSSYKCPRCGKTVNPKRGTRLGDYI